MPNHWLPSGSIQSLFLDLIGIEFSLVSVTLYSFRWKMYKKRFCKTAALRRTFMHSEHQSLYLMTSAFDAGSAKYLFAKRTMSAASKAVTTWLSTLMSGMKRYFNWKYSNELKIARKWFILCRSWKVSEGSIIPKKLTDKTKFFKIRCELVSLTLKFLFPGYQYSVHS